MTTELVDASVQNIPAKDIKFLEPFAARKGHNLSRAGICKFAVIELADLLRRENDNGNTPAATPG